MYQKFVWMALFLTLRLHADSHDTNTTKTNYIDKTHEIVSDKVVTISDQLDTKLSKIIHSKEKNATKSVDTFFKNKKFMQETQETYVQTRFLSFFQSKRDNRYDALVTAQIPLTRSQKKLNIFIKNVNDEINNNLTPQSSTSPYSPIIGINYFTPTFYGINSKYLIGVNGFNLITQARYYIVFHAGMWKIEPTQTFTYSTKDKFIEQTNLYFDRQLDELNLFRTVLHRQSSQLNAGMDYALSFQYYYMPKRNSGLSISETFSGNTQYKYIHTTPLGVQNEKFSAINNYETAISWRQSVFREWLYYQITPGVSFHKDFEYAPNYTLVFLIDLYFGKLN